MSKFKKYSIIVLILFILLIVQSRNPNISGPFKGIIGNMVNPIVYYVKSVTQFFDNMTENYVFLINVKKENDQLKQKVNELKLENAILNEKNAEFDRLKKLLRFKEAYNFETIACNVIAKNIDTYIKYFIIDRGKSDGIEINDAIISYEGLVGIVTDVYQSTAKVSVILNIKTNVSVMNFRSRTVGILNGNGKGSLAVSYYDRLDEVNRNDLMITSGLGGVYPKGIPVGYVVQSHGSESGIFQKLDVDSRVNFYKLENVLVIKNVKE